MSIEAVCDEWERENEPHLRACSDRFVAVTYSAGRDSTACLELLSRVQPRYRFRLGAFLYVFPRHRYPEELLRRIESYWRPRLDAFAIRRSDEDDSVLADAAALGDDPCRPCQDLRKRALPEVFSLAKVDPPETVIASGHSLWDLAGYALNRFAQQELNEVADTPAEAARNRFLEVSQRFYAFLDMPEGYSVFRPMLCLSDEDIEEVCAAVSSPLVAVPCRYSKQRPKKVLGEYFRRFGFEFTHRGLLDFAERFLGIPPRTEFEAMNKDEFLVERF